MSLVAFFYFSWLPWGSFIELANRNICRVVLLLSWFLSRWYCKLEHHTPKTWTENEDAARTIFFFWSRTHCFVSLWNISSATATNLLRSWKNKQSIKYASKNETWSFWFKKIFYLLSSLFVQSNIKNPGKKLKKCDPPLTSWEIVCQPWDWPRYCGWACTSKLTNYVQAESE